MFIIAFLFLQEFLVHLLQQEKAKSEARLTNSPRAHTPQKISKEILADPLVFIRRWIGEVCFLSDGVNACVV